MDWPVALVIIATVLSIAAMSVAHSWKPFERRCKCECHAKHVADAPSVQKPL